MEDTINLSQKKAEQVIICIRKYRPKINYPFWKYSFSNYYKVPKENLEIN